MSHILVSSFLFVVVESSVCYKEEKNEVLLQPQRNPGETMLGTQTQCAGRTESWRSVQFLSHNVCFHKSGWCCTFNFINGERGFCLGDVRSTYQNEDCFRLSWPHQRGLNMQVALWSSPETLQNTTLTPWLQKGAKPEPIFTGSRKNKIKPTCWKLLPLLTMHYFT